MSTKLQLGGLVLFLLILLGPVTHLNNGQHPLHSAIEVDEPGPLTKEQQALVDHLSQKYAQSSALTERVVRAAYKEGEERSLSPLLILAIVEKESSFRHEVVNSYGAMGLMQVVPRYHRDKLAASEGKDQLLHPETNIKVGSQILAEYMDAKKGNLQAALKKYSGNARQYFQRVAAYRERLRDVARHADDKA